jgi:16S rRNA (cytosine1407-C5)-methyltransferase
MHSPENSPISRGNEHSVTNDPLPAEFLSRLRHIVGAEHYERCLTSFSSDKATTFRVNTLLTSNDDACAEMVRCGVQFEPITWCESAFSVPGSSRGALLATRAFREGRIYVQNASSLLPVLILDPQPGEKVLDLAAAPGGKTLHIAAKMQNRGLLSAVEVVRSRLYKLQNNLSLHAASIVKTYLTDGRSVGNKTPNRFDRVLLDAPCSAEARFRTKDSDTWRYWSPRKIREQARKQAGLLRSAIKSLKPGGTLVYCTCSFAPEENELVIQTQLTRNSDRIQLLPIELTVSNWIPGLAEWNGKHLSSELRQARRVLPTESMDAFFLAKITKVAD